MSRPLRALFLILFVAACGARDTSAPKSLDNACSILDQRPHFVRAFKATERKWNVPVHVQMATLYQESKFIADARTPFRWSLGVIPMGRQSSAYGYAQALDATWEEYQKATNNPRARRDDIRDAADFMGWYFNITRDRNGISLNDARAQYLNYHEGHTGYRRGTHNSKAWLLRISSEVAARAGTYEAQLRSCRRFR
ncbi:transglycosylase SLT domain-containing protein [Rhodalgimonas zhirmunskyi]|uniref:Lytic transglycosylase n=1 Tax=Rhodalgimonas zhirmunskyi TaxID=2964767 RepID=A0AAJ1X554_9RHOB|nr:lytic transglycosylase [Rhodoalgimonas zhirmunskyi]MDQ2094206.1 lytic transglycosylase [Rhodoalgimonas zhirmunskyi]